MVVHQLGLVCGVELFGPSSSIFFGGQVKPKLHMPPMPTDLEASEESCFGQMTNGYDGSKGGDNRTTMSNYKLHHFAYHCNRSSNLGIILENSERRETLIESSLQRFYICL